jgi:hypothetical protein
MTALAALLLTGYAYVGIRLGSHLRAEPGGCTLTFSICAGLLWPLTCAVGFWLLVRGANRG